MCHRHVIGSEVMIILESGCRSGPHLYNLHFLTPSFKPTLFRWALSQSAFNPDAKHAHYKHQPSVHSTPPAGQYSTNNRACGLHSAPLCQHGGAQNICPENLLTEDFTQLKTAYFTKHCPIHKLHRMLRYTVLLGIRVATSICSFTLKCA